MTDVLELIRAVVYMVGGTQDMLMHMLPVQDAKARVSEFVDMSLENGPQKVICCGTDVAVLVPVEEWQRLQQTARPTLKKLLLTDARRADLLVSKRGGWKRRPLVAFD